MRAVLAALILLPCLAAAEEKLPSPTAAQSAKARLAITDSLGGEIERAKTPAARKALAVKMLGLANDAKETAANRWVLFTRAADMAANAGDATTAIKAFRDSARPFDFDPLSATADLAEQIAKNSLPSKAMIDFAISSAEESIMADYYLEAKRLFVVALNAAKSGKDFATIDRIKVRAKYAAELAKEYEAANGDDEATGRFQAFRKGDWAKGLPLLAKSKQEGLAAVAKKDAGNPVEAKDRVDLGDAWYELAGQTKGEDRLGMLRRAMGWYRQGVGGMGGLAKAKIEGRMGAIFQEVDAADARDGLFTQLEGTWKLIYDNKYTHIYQINRIGVLTLIQSIDPEGKITGSNVTGYLTLVRRGNEVFGIYYDRSSNMTERFRIVSNSLIVERFTKPSDYPKKRELYAVGNLVNP